MFNQLVSFSDHFWLEFVPTFPLTLSTLFGRTDSRQSTKLCEQGVLCHHGTMGSYGATRRSPRAQWRCLQVGAESSGGQLMSLKVVP